MASHDTQRLCLTGPSPPAPEQCPSWKELCDKLSVSTNWADDEDEDEESAYHTLPTLPSGSSSYSCDGAAFVAATPRDSVKDWEKMKSDLCMTANLAIEFFNPLSHICPPNDSQSPQATADVSLEAFRQNVMRAEGAKFEPPPRLRVLDSKILETVYEDAEVDDLSSDDDSEHDSLCSTSSLEDQRSDESHDSRASSTNRDDLSLEDQRSDESHDSRARLPNRDLSSLEDQRSDESHDSRAWLPNRDPSSTLHQRMIEYRIHTATEDDCNSFFRTLSRKLSILLRRLRTRLKGLCFQMC